MSDNGARALTVDVRRVITDAYYETRNEGLTMEAAADRARDAVMALLPDAAELERLRRIEAAARDWLEANTRQDWAWTDDRRLGVLRYALAAREAAEGSARDGG